MEVIEFTKELFEGRNVRILGTIEEPLFVANDIGKLLGIKKIADSISHFNESKKVSGFVRGPGGVQKTSLLTENGLYTVLFTSKMEIAEKFQKWALRVLKEIRLRGRYDIREDIEKQIINEQIQEAAAVERPIQQQQPQLYDPDINQYRDCNVVYLYHITEGFYKFGHTDNIIRRANEHRDHFLKHGHTITRVRFWKCDSSFIMRDIEDMVKVLARENNLIRNKFDMTEILETPNVDEIIDRIDKYLNDKISYHGRYFEMQMKKLEIEKINASNERLRLKIKLLELSQSRKLSRNRLKFIERESDDYNDNQSICAENETLMITKNDDITPIMQANIDVSTENSNNIALIESPTNQTDSVINTKKKPQMSSPMRILTEICTNKNDKFVAKDEGVTRILGEELLEYINNHLAQNEKILTSGLLGREIGKLKVIKSVQELNVNKKLVRIYEFNKNELQIALCKHYNVNDISILTGLE